MRFFRRRPSGPPEPPAPEPLRGELPRYHDHVVRIGVEVEPRDEAAFLGMVGGQPWQTQDLGSGRHDVRVGVSGSALGSTGAALSEFHHALARAGVSARVEFAARLRPRSSPSRRYLVLPRGWVPERELMAAFVRGLMAWRSKGTIEAASLTQARSRLTGFADRNPGAGPPGDLMVVGPPDRSGSTHSDEGAAPVDPMSDRRFLLLTAILISAGMVAISLLLTVGRPEGVTCGAAVASIIAIPCLFGVWQMFRRVPEGRLNTWLPLGLTALAAPLAVALGSLSHDVYLSAFGIESGEVAQSGPGRLIALAGTLPLVLFALLFSLGVFGLLRYFHLGSRGAQFLQWLMAVGAVCLYGLTAVSVLMDRDTEQGRDHVAVYQSTGGPARGHAGVLPSVMCVEPGPAPVSRIGPPLTTDRPVLYFAGANNVDLLWDREEGLTKVPRFSVSLTPVTDLDSACPAPEATG